MDRNARLAAASVLILLLAALGWWQFGDLSAPRGPGEEETGAAGPPQSRSTERIADKNGSNQTESQREQIEPAQVPAEKFATGSARIRVIYGDDESPAVGIGVRYFQSRKANGSPVWCQVKTDDRGEIRLARLPPGKITVGTDHQRKFERGIIAAGEETELLITLEDGVDISGVVVDTSNMPVPGATIVFAGWAASRPRAMGRTDAAGRFLLRQCERLSNVGARARGYTPSPLRSVSAGKGAKVEIRIVMPGAGGSVHGIVLDPDRKPVVGAIVNLGVKPDNILFDLPDGAKGMRTPQTKVETDAEGRFRAEGLAPGALPVTVKTERFAAWIGSVPVVANVNSPMSVNLTHGVTCEGTVRDEKGRPVEGVEVTNGTWDYVYRRSILTSADGAFRIDGLEPGEIKLTASGEKRGNASTVLKGVAGDVLRWDARLSLGIVLRGVVHGKGDKPLKNVFVHASTRSWIRIERTADDGTFELIDCPEGHVIDLRVEYFGYARLNRKKLDARTGPLELHMRWEGEATARIIGRVVDPEGKPVSAAQVLLRGGSGGIRTLDAEGKIDYRKLRPGEYRLRVEADAYPILVSDSKTIASGETWDVGSLQLVRGGRLLVEAQLPKGSEQEKLYMTIYEKGGAFAARITTSKRPFLSRPIAPGEYKLRISGPAIIPLQALPFRVNAERETRVPVRLQVGSPVSLVFELPEPVDEIEGVRLTLTGPDGFRHDRRFKRWQPARGRYKMGLVPGRYRVRASSGSGRTGDLEFDVAAHVTPRAERKMVRVVLR